MAKPGKVRRLADGEDDRVAIDCLFAALDKLRIKPPVLVEYPAGLDQFDAGHFTTATKDAFRAKARVEPDAFLFRFLDLLTGRRDLVEVLQTVHVHLGDALADSFACDVQREAHLVGCFDLTRGQLLERRCGFAQSLAQFGLAHPRKHFCLADNGTRHVEGHVTASDYNNFTPECDTKAEIYIEQEFNRPKHSVELNTFDRQIATLVRTDAQKHGFEPLLFQVGQFEFPTELVLQANFNTERLDRSDFCMDNLPRQPVFGDSQYQHSARRAVRLKHRYRKPQQRQFVRAGETRGP